MVRLQRCERYFRLVNPPASRFVGPSLFQPLIIPMPVPPHHFDDEPVDPRPGGLLGDLERRQEDVLNQLDDLDAKLSEVLKGLETTPMQRPTDPSASPKSDRDTDAEQAFDLDDSIDAEDDFGSVEDWA